MQTRTKVSQVSQVSKGFSTLWILIAVAVVGVVAIIAFGILDVAKLKKPAQYVLPEDKQVQQLQTLGQSDEISVIEQDIDNTNLDNLDAEMGEVEQDLQSL